MTVAILDWSSGSLISSTEFLVGDDLLVAPVVDLITGGSMDVVLPPGQWLQEGTEIAFTGPQTITVSNITLDTLVYFTRIQT